ncbi:MAG TPA: hypothetical protein VK633_12535 [Verrucomicrobiae bacterium]|nr:hypothetical protein [Verrucomicrobiae bacterium]
MNDLERNHPRTNSRPPAPTTLIAAALLIVAYGLGVLAFELLAQFLSRNEFAFPSFRSIVRFLGLAFLGWGLTQCSAVAWWVALILAAVWCVLGAFGLSTLLFLVIQNSEALFQRLNLFFVAMNTLLLFAAALLLLTPSARRACHR